jgi:UDP-glucose 4-epimerase
MGETGDDALVPRLITECEVSAIVHFAASIVVPNSVADPLGYYRNNTVNSRVLIECAVRSGSISDAQLRLRPRISLLDVIDTVKRASGMDFRVDRAGRRPGDPARIVAQSDRARELLGWTPQFDDLATIVAHALAWERKLSTLEN